MKKLLRNSLMIGAAVLGIGSFGTIAEAATTTPTPSTSTATADITPGTITIGSTVPGFDFGTVASSANDATYTSASEVGNLEVLDPGNASGYTVTVADSPFTATGGGTLTGEKLDFNDSVTNPTTAVDADNVSTIPVLTKSLNVTSAPATILSAAAGSGVGDFKTTYAPTDATLSVPAGNIGGSYSSTLTWTLNNAPA
mgnify:CR=1 FL=1